MKLEVEEEYPKVRFNLVKTAGEKFGAYLLISIIYIVAVGLLTTFVRPILLIHVSILASLGEIGILVILLIHFGIIYLIGKLTTRTKEIIVDTQTKTITSPYGGSEFTYDENAPLDLKRDFVVRVSTTTDSEGHTQTTTSYNTVWTLEQNDYIIYKGETGGLSHPFIDYLTEELSKHLDSTIHDHTGTQLIVKEPQTKDVPLVTKLREEEIKPFNKNMYELHGFTIERHDSRYVTEIKSSGFWSTVGYFILFVLTIPFAAAGLFGFIYLLSLFPIDALRGIRESGLFFTMFLIPLIAGPWWTINRFRTKTLIHIDHEGIHQIEDQLFRKVHKWDMALDELEHLHIIETWENKRTLEFVSDTKRITIPRDIPPNDLPKIKEVIERILVSV